MLSSSALSHSLGWACSSASAGVVNCHCTRLPSRVSSVETSPASIVAVYVVEKGMRPSGSKAIICVPSQRNLPGGWGLIASGERSSLRSSIEASGTIGWLNTALTVPTRPGAFSIGAVRSTCSGPLSAGSWVCLLGGAGGGNGSSTRSATLGGGLGPGTGFNSVVMSPGSGVIAGTPAHTSRTGPSAAATFCSAGLSGPGVVDVHEHRTAVRRPSDGRVTD
nr:hypothetical protein [Nannocystis sp.]